ncbi:DUF2787 family protein [Psychromonas sp. MME2]|uniref:DUF2787 family protein n=1 Tax=unclassified Psychromonas TaxID=2614957 RepID=UPI00339BE34D
MDIKFNQSVIKISNRLFAVLKQAIERQVVKREVSQITFNYRDSSYSCDAGGYHPVEIALQKDQESNSWSLLYITDFCYYGHPYAELCKDLDFDFETEFFMGVYTPPRPMSQPSVKEIYNLWQDNFLSYLEYGAFDEIEVNAC